MKRKFSIQSTVWYNDSDRLCTLSGVFYEGSGSPDDLDSLDDFRVILLEHSKDITDELDEQTTEELKQELASAYSDE